MRGSHFYEWLFGTSRRETRPWPQKITNEELYQKTGQRDITIVIKQQRRRWLGHVIRKDQDCITRTALRWIPDSGRRKRGWPRERWRRRIEAEMKTKERPGMKSRRLPVTERSGNLSVSALCAIKAPRGSCQTSIP